MIICNFITLSLIAQKIKITASDEPLSNVLIMLRDSYGAEFSFNDTEVAKHTVTLNNQFNSIDDALTILLKDSPFEFEKNGTVYIIFKKKQTEPNKDKKVKKQKAHYISGFVVQYGTNEALPFSVVLINDIPVVCDENGRFHHRSYKDSVFSLKISHLGYFVKDTTVYKGYNKKFELLPSIQSFDEVIIRDSLFENFTVNGEDPGVIKLNHMISKYMPGSSDNSVFNLLRLQPGITASAELTSDLIIWGAYQGQSQVLFDGFTLFGLKNFNDNISAVNPYMVKHMMIHKGGYSSKYGDRVGGIVEITGKNGGLKKPSFDYNISNFTMNGLVQLPLGTNSTLLLSGRKTYYQLFDQNDFEFVNRINKDSTVLTDFYPKYEFYDLNVKYTYQNENGELFYISALRGKDLFVYDFERILDNSVFDDHILYREKTETNLQNGISSYFGKSWKQGFQTSFLIAYSSLRSDLTDSLNITNKLNNPLRFGEATSKVNTDEYKIQIDNSVSINENHMFETGISFIQNSSSVLRESPLYPVSFLSTRGEQINFYMQDVYSKDKLNLTFGGRIIFLPYLNSFYFDPRVTFSSEIVKKLKFNLAWGKYKQFVSKTSVIDDYGNYYYIWTVADNDNIPVLRSTHFVSGFSYSKGGFNLNVEGYLKSTRGLSRYFRRIFEQTEDLYTGQSRSIGADIFIKQNFKGHSAWLAYSISETEEKFDYQTLDIWLAAPQSQKHEFKIAGMLNLDPFYISANYVYGSGFTLVTRNLSNPFIETGYYGRLDASAVYKFSAGTLSFETGLSVLNILNKENIRFSNFERIPANQNLSYDIYNEPVPFMPTFFLKIGF